MERYFFSLRILKNSAKWDNNNILLLFNLTKLKLEYLEYIYCKQSVFPTSYFIFLLVYVT